MLDVWAFEKQEITNAVKKLGIALYHWNRRNIVLTDADKVLKINLLTSMYQLKIVLEEFCSNETIEIDDAIRYFNSTQTVPTFKLTATFKFLARRIKEDKLMLKG